LGISFYVFGIVTKEVIAKMNECSAEQKLASKTRNTPRKGSLLPLTPCTNLLISATLIQVTFLPFWYFYQINHHGNVGTSKQSKSTSRQKLLQDTGNTE
jgi:hypothetical protein